MSKVQVVAPPEGRRLATSACANGGSRLEGRTRSRATTRIFKQSHFALGLRGTAVMARHRLRLVNRPCNVLTRNPMFSLSTSGQVSLGRHGAARVARPPSMTPKKCKSTKIAFARREGVVAFTASGARCSKIQPDQHVQMFLRCDVAATIALARAGRRSMTPRSPTREEQRSECRAQRVVRFCG